MATSTWLAGIPGGTLGAFACPPDDTDWDCDIYQCGSHVIAFPSSPVWITFAGRPRVLADRTQVMLHRSGQWYTRSRVADHGDFCRYIALTDALVREIAAESDPAAAESPEFAFGQPYARINPMTYLALRTSLAAALATDDAVRVTEACFGAARIVIRTAAASAGIPLPRVRSATRARQELVEAAKSLIAASVQDSATTAIPSLTEIARRLHVSPYHLTRSFTLATGEPLHRYLTDVRLRAGLDFLLDEPEISVATIAHNLGFASHAHFTTSFRALFGTTPTAARTACPPEPRRREPRRRVPRRS